MWCGKESKHQIPHSTDTCQLAQASPICRASIKNDKKITELDRMNYFL